MKYIQSECDDYKMKGAYEQASEDELIPKMVRLYCRECYDFKEVKIELEFFRIGFVSGNFIYRCAECESSLTVDRKYPTIKWFNKKTGDEI